MTGRDAPPRPARRRLCGLALAAAALRGFAAPETAIAGDPPAAYPNRPIRLVVPFGPGNQLDVFARLVGASLAEALGQPVIVENRPGVAGNAASEAVAHAAPDGYTLLVSGVLITLLPLTYGSLAVDPVSAFAPVTRLAQQPIVIAASATSNLRTIGDLLALAHASPGAVAYATAGVGTAQHVAMTMLSQRAGVTLLHVPYANTGQMMADAISGVVPVVVTYPVSIDPHRRSGRLNVLAVTSAHRALAWPDVPTIAESGFPDFDVLSWVGVLAPAGTPPPIVARLHREIVRILALPDVRATFLAQSAEPVGNTPAQFAAEIRASVARWAPVVRAAGIRVD